MRAKKNNDLTYEERCIQLYDLLKGIAERNATGIEDEPLDRVNPDVRSRDTRTQPEPGETG